MAENKKSFILYVDLIHTIEKMPSEKAGELFLHILKYVNDLNPISEDLIINLTFEPIKQQLKRDLVKWDKFVEKQRINGSLGGRPSKIEEPKVNPNNPSVILENPTEPKKADNVTVTVSDSVNVNVKKGKKKKDVAKDLPLVKNDYALIVDFWLKEFKPSWTFGGQHGKALKSIIKKLTSIFPESNIVDVFKLMCLKLPEWYKDKDLPVIDSKLNEILEQIKNTQNEKRKTDSNGKPISIFAPNYES